MNHSDYRHPKHDAAAVLLREGVTVRETARQVGMAVSAVSRVRAIEGIERDRAVPVEVTLAASIIPVLDPHAEDIDTGHTIWTGKRNHGTPVIRHKGREMSAAAVLYEQRTGRAPVGQAKSECEGFPHCMTASHIADEADRTRERRQLRALLGYGRTANFCSEGHDQAIHGGVEPNLKVYCRRCGTERRSRNRAKG